MAEVPQPGDRILGKYKVEHVLGTGGMGTVYAATDEQLGRTVAIKLLNELSCNDENAARLALRDGQAGLDELLGDRHALVNPDAGVAARGLLAHAMPIFIAQLASIGMMVVDTVVLGHVSALDLAAVARSVHDVVDRRAVLALPLVHPMVSTSG